MAHFDYFAGFTDPIPAGHVPGSVEYTLLWKQQYKSANFDDGGTWASAASVTLGGAGFNLTDVHHKLAEGARFTVLGTGEIKVNSSAVLTLDAGSVLDLYGSQIVRSGGSVTVQSGSTVTTQSGSTVNQSVGATWNLDGTTSLKGTLTVENTSGGGPGGIVWEVDAVLDIGSVAARVLSGAYLTWQNGSHLVGGTSATGSWLGAWTFGNTVTFNATSSIAGNASATAVWAGHWTFSGTTTHTGQLVHSGDDAYRVLRVDVGPDDDATVEPWKADILQVPVLTGHRVWLLDHPPSNVPFESTIEWPTTSGLYSIELRDGSQKLAILYDTGDRTEDNIVGAVVLAYDGAEYFVKAVRKPVNKHEPGAGSITVDAWKYDVLSAANLGGASSWGFSAPPDNKPHTVIVQWAEDLMGATLTVLGISLTFPTTANGTNAICFYNGNAWAMLSQI